MVIWAPLRSEHNARARARFVVRVVLFGPAWPEQDNPNSADYMVMCRSERVRLGWFSSARSSLCGRFARRSGGGGAQQSEAALLPRSSNALTLASADRLPRAMASSLCLCVAWIRDAWSHHTQLAAGVWQFCEPGQNSLRTCARKLESLRRLFNVNGAFAS